MEDGVKTLLSPKDTLRARYLPENGFYELFFEVDGKTKVVTPIYEPNFDCNGAYMRRIIDNVAEKLKCYGIGSDDIISSIIQECNSSNFNVPKIINCGTKL